jgi:lipopolysaccharide/colanic/teichoic acid biosynthesis glycosyltransferase
MTLRTYHSLRNRSYLLLKRAFDVILAALGIAVLLPFLPLVAVLIKLDSRGPVFFTQERLGQNGELFTLYKLRTMVENAGGIKNPDGSCFVAKNDARLTRVGRFLRDYSLDELPQLLNILKGDMSVVGPRPDTPGAPGLDGELFQKKRLVKPGLTSLASIHGRNAIPWGERVAWELKYVDNVSWKLDLYILFKTVFLVIRREGIYSPD